MHVGKNGPPLAALAPALGVQNQPEIVSMYLCLCLRTYVSTSEVSYGGNLGPLGVSWGHLGANLGPLGISWGHLGASWSLLEAF